MIQLHILSGKQAGSEIVVRRFPFVIGRGQADFRLEDDGVWERHARIDFNPQTGFTLAVHAEARAMLNGELLESGLLRNGDSLQLGSASLRVWLTRTEQLSLRWRESLTWTALLGLMGGQAALVYVLLR